MRKSVFHFGAVMAAAFFLPIVASAPDAGASLLTKRMPDGKVCRADLGQPHMHAANGANPDKTAAQIKAIRDWVRFTAFEYGRRWGDWSLARDHTMTCIHDEEAGVWRCRAEAQPCRAEVQKAPAAMPKYSGRACGSWFSLACVQRIVQPALIWKRY